MKDKLYVCDDVYVLSNKDKFLEIDELLGFEAQTCN